MKYIKQKCLEMFLRLDCSFLKDIYCEINVLTLEQKSNLGEKKRKDKYNIADIG